MNTKVICFASAKGGSGKTVTAASMAKFLGGIGKKILLIDTDAGTNGLTLLYLDELIKVRDLLKGEKVVPRGLFESGPNEIPETFEIEKSVSLIPSTYVLKQTRDMSIDDFRELIPNTISFFSEGFDYIILDAQAGAGLFAQVSMEFADEIIIVSEYDPISAEGVDRLKQLFPAILTYDKTWILLNKVLPEFSKSLRDFLGVVRYLSPIPWDSNVVRAFTKRKLAIDMVNVNEYTLAIMESMNTLLGENIEEEVTNWKKSREEKIRTPVIDNLHKIEKLIEGTEKARIDTEYKLNESITRIRYYSNVFVLLLAASIPLFYFLIRGEEYDPLFTVIVRNISEWSLVSLFILLPFLIVIIYQMRYLIERREREKSKIDVFTIRELDRQLKDLTEQRDKYKTIVDSDLETIIKDQKNLK